MAFFKNVKRAFGFSDPMDECEDIEGIDATVYPLASRKNYVKEQVDNSIENSLDVEPRIEVAVESIDQNMAQKMIFDSVVKIFNESLPGFLRDTVDEASQRDYLYNALDVSIKSYLNQVEETARNANRTSWEKERLRLETENRDITEKYKALNAKIDDGKKLQLSAERQKRALAERVHDLESQIATLESEKEQYELENKSLINKLRLASITSPDASDFERLPEIEELQAKCDELKGVYEEAKNRSQELEAAKEKLESENISYKERLDNLIRDNVDLKSKYDEAVSQLAESSSMRDDISGQLDKANKVIEDMKIQAEIADTMINNLNSKASQASQISDESQESLRRAELERDEAKKLLVETQQKLVISSQEIEALEAEMDDARKAIGMLEEIQEQLSHFEEVKESKDRRINELSSENNRLLVIVDSLKEEKNSLNKTIETNLYAQAESEKRLMAEIEKLQNEISGVTPPLKELPEENPKVSKRRGKSKISAIDESVTDIDWLVSAAGDDSKSYVAESDENFGYQVPSKKRQPDNDAQMSLF